MSDKIAYVGSELFKVLCNRFPGVNELKYFDELEKPPAQVPLSSAITHQARIKLCIDNPNAKKFNEIYEQLRTANAKPLEPYIMLLESIKKNSVVMELLKENMELENESEITNQLSSRRNQRSTENIAIPKESRNKKTVPIPSTIIKYKYNSLDFLDLSDIPACQIEFPLIKLLDKSNQENVLVKDLLNCLRGCPGLYVRPLPLEGIERQFFIDATMHPQFMNVVKTILVTASHASIIARFIDTHSGYEYGTVNQALAGAMDQQLQDFRLLVCQMEDLFRKENLTLTSMMNYVQEPGTMMRLMAGICTDIQKVNCKGGAILSLFSDFNSSVGSTKLKELLKYLMHCASFPFFRTLKFWIFRGIITDTYEEFFIREDPKHQIQKSPSLNDITVNPNFWSLSYNIETHLVPRFLERHVDKILNTGKYLNVIQLCGSDTEFPEIEDMVYETDEEYFLTQIDRAYDYASKLLLDIMFNKMKLKDHFNFMKHCFLLGDAEWLNIFMDMASDELNEKRTESESQRVRLESLLDGAIQNRILDPFRQNLRVELSNQELIPFIFQVISFKPDNKRIHNEVIGQNLRVLEAFTLNTVTVWPISLVFHSSIMQRYQILFRHLFYCHHVARVLLSVSVNCRRILYQKSYSSPLIYKASALGNKMNYFIRDLIYYMKIEVIEPLWNVFQTKLDQAQNIDEVFEFHHVFIQSCITNCMLNSKNMLKSLQKMMVLCVTYANRYNRLLNNSLMDRESKRTVGYMEDSPFENMINQDDANFTIIMKNLIREINESETDNKILLTLAQRMEFNTLFSYRSNDSDVDA